MYRFCSLKHTISCTVFLPKFIASIYSGNREIIEATEADSSLSSQNFASESQWRTQEFFSGGGVSTNSVEDRGQRERGSGGVAPYSGVLEAAVIWYKKFHLMQ